MRCYLIAQASILAFTPQRVERFTRHKVGIPVTTFFVSCFVTSHAIHVWADAKLYQPIIITYPAEPVYCSIETNRNLTVVVQTDNEQVVDLSNIKRNTLNKVANYYSTASSIEGLMTTTLFGVPEIYQDALSQKRPVLR